MNISTDKQSFILIERWGQQQHVLKSHQFESSSSSSMLMKNFKPIFGSMLTTTTLLDDDIFSRIHPITSWHIRNI
ncbi:hypothetical protein DERF_014770 [Dermatophagoides farinae]|uniref:Uncharacterized protein n=1 Tax=Dermatophagoides farinae TaxID=6954 RepID=A0A922KTR6_DERFA|nr:hypothetical protein DERF_014770 [Dermatophagoides farinae]